MGRRERKRKTRSSDLYTSLFLCVWSGEKKEKAKRPFSHQPFLPSSSYLWDNLQLFPLRAQHAAPFFFLRSRWIREGKAFYFPPSPLSVPPIIPPPPSRGTLLSLAAIRLVCVSFLSSLFFFYPPPPLWGPLAALNLHYAGFEAAAGDHSSAKGYVYARASRTHTHTPLSLYPPTVLRAVASH